MSIYEQLERFDNYSAEEHIKRIHLFGEKILRAYGKKFHKKDDLYDQYKNNNFEHDKISRENEMLFSIIEIFRGNIYANTDLNSNIFEFRSEFPFECKGKLEIFLENEDEIADIIFSVVDEELEKLELPEIYRRLRIKWGEKVNL